MNSSTRKGLIQVVILITCFVLFTSILFAQRPEEYNIERTLSDEAQLNTISFDGLAFMVNNIGAQAFLPPGKVADYAGFQYLRDNDPTQMGHNTDFVTIIAFNMLTLLTPSQIQMLINSAGIQIDQINQYAYQRYPLISAFTRMRDNNLPAGTNILSMNQVKQYSAQLYELDGVISYGRAKVFGQLYQSLTPTQLSTITSWAALNGIGNWNTTLPNPLQGYNLPPDISVAVMTYASEFYAWFAGSVEADVYFCPERQGTYFGSFFLKDWPAMGNPNYTINEQLTAVAGERFLNILNPAQKGLVTDLVDMERQYLLSIVETRQSISQLLRGFLANQTVDSTQVIQLSNYYGELDGALVYNMAMHFANIKNSLTTEQFAQIQAMTDSLGYLDPQGGFLYSAPISMPNIINTDFFFVDGVLQHLPDTGQTSDNTSTFGEDSDYTLNVPDLTDMSNGVIKDNVTGLYWQKDDGGEMTWENAKIYAANLLLGGFNDWRLPTSHEVFNILNHGLFPAIDTQYFPLNGAEYWWSSNQSVTDTTKIWVANSGGGMGDHPRNETISAGGNKSFHIRCVRGDIAVSLFKENEDGTVTDMRTGLMWSQSAPATATWETALSNCETSTTAGYSDWRLPNITELRSISNDHLNNSSLDPMFFPSAVAQKYWSSTTEHDAQRAWFVNFLSGLVAYDNKTTLNYVIMVRNTTNSVENDDNTQTPVAVCHVSVYPNPSRLSDEVTFETKINSNDIGTLTISNIKGQKVKSFKVDSATTKLSWNHKDENNHSCASGIYFYRLSTKTHKETRKMVILK
jgi:hypothetical protein